MKAERNMQPSPAVMHNSHTVRHQAYLIDRQNAEQITPRQKRVRQIGWTINVLYGVAGVMLAWTLAELLVK